MAQFTYIKKDGSQGTIDAADSASAIKALPSDADPHSGVQASLSGTGTPSPATSDYSLPQTGGKESPLLSFANSLDAAVELARKARNASSLNLMAPYQGTVAASDFNSILSGLNTASDKTSENLIKNATDAQLPDIVTTTNDNGDVSGINKNTGEIVWTAKGVGNKQEGKLGNSTVLGGINTLLTTGVTDSNGTPYLAPDGKMTWEGFQTLLRAAQADGMTRKQFLDEYGSYLQPGVNKDYSGYGLTTKEILYLKGL